MFNAAQIKQKNSSKTTLIDEERDLTDRTPLASIPRVEIPSKNNSPGSVDVSELPLTPEWPIKVTKTSSPNLSQKILKRDIILKSELPPAPTISSQNNSSPAKKNAELNLYQMILPQSGSDSSGSVESKSVAKKELSETNSPVVLKNVDLSLYEKISIQTDLSSNENSVKETPMYFIF